MSDKINIAIDGHSSCGKSTLAKALAKSLSYIYIDSGAMYRAVALYCIQNNIDPLKEEDVVNALSQIHITFKTKNRAFRVLLNETDVTDRIIQIDVSNIVSEIAAISEVRSKLVKLQQAIGKDKGVVMDGRDIGTVVFPDAELKLFITAHIDIRTRRRFLELKEKGMDTPVEEVQKNLIHRDHIDSSREDSPLIQSEDAILIDNSFMNQEEQLFLANKIVAGL